MHTDKRTTDRHTQMFRQKQKQRHQVVPERNVNAKPTMYTNVDESAARRAK